MKRLKKVSTFDAPYNEWVRWENDNTPTIWFKDAVNDHATLKRVGKGRWLLALDNEADITYRALRLLEGTLEECLVQANAILALEGLE